MNEIKPLLNYPRTRLIALMILGGVSVSLVPRLCAQVQTQNSPLLAAGGSLAAQVPALALSYGSGKTLAIQPDWYPNKQDFQPIAVYVGQALQFTLQFPTAFAGQTIAVWLDEGPATFTTPTNSGVVPIGQDGRVTIGFQAPQNSGHYHLVFQLGSRNSVLPLSVRDLSQMGTPANCPVAQ